MKALQNQNGMSLLFVLAVMLLLLALGVSALTAAGLNFGAGTAQRERSQLHLYAHSMERVIRAALENSEEQSETALVDAETLGGWIMRDVLFTENAAGFWEWRDEFAPVFNAPIGTTAIPAPILIELSGFSVSSEKFGAEYEIEVFGAMTVQVSPYRRYFVDMYWVPHNAMRFEATVTGQATIRLTTRFTTPGGSVLTSVTETVYSLVDASAAESLPYEIKAFSPSPDEIIILNPDEWSWEWRNRG